MLARSTTPPVPTPILAADDTGRAARLGRPFVAPLRAFRLPGAGLTRGLTVLGRPIATHLAEKATLTIAGVLVPAVAHLVLALAGLSLRVEVPIVAALMLSAAGFVLPDLHARSDAAKHRTGLRHALSAYLDLVWITLARGAGVDSALNDSVAIGRGWAFEQIRRALDTARLTRTTPWATLRQLGQELDVAELSELAASVSLAGTERMSLPIMALFLGFLTFIAYPALTQVLNGLILDGFRISDGLFDPNWREAVPMMLTGCVSCEAGAGETEFVVQPCRPVIVGQFSGDQNIAARAENVIRADQQGHVVSGRGRA